MSTLRLTTLIAGIVAVVLLIGAYSLEAVARTELVPGPVMMLLRIATVIVWLGHFTAHCRDTLIDHIDKTAANAVQIVVPNTNRALDLVLAAIRAAMDEAMGEAEARGATEARIDTLSKLGGVSGVSVDPVRPTGHRLGVVDN